MPYGSICSAIEVTLINNDYVQSKMENIRLGIYHHYKGNLYRVLGVARHSETLEEVVVYQALYESKEFGKDSLWVRPKKMFMGNVVVEGKEVPRFEFVREKQE